jgi:hypothetical protein
MENHPTRMDLIIDARYGSLVILQNLNAFPTTDYLKYLPKYDLSREVKTEEHLASFYSFADNQNIEHQYV